MLAVVSKLYPLLYLASTAILVIGMAFYMEGSYLTGSAAILVGVALLIFVLILKKRLRTGSP